MIICLFLYPITRMHNKYAITRSPAKVLVAGGYGVLEQNNIGLALSLNAYFYCICTVHQEEVSNQIHVISRQLRNNWIYMWEPSIETVHEKNNKHNNFVENAILWSLRFFNKSHNAGKIVLEILFDRHFISESDAEDQLQFPFYRQGYSKTGLGSSACVLTSIVKCLVNIFSHNLCKESQKLNIINVISQAANIAAQNKIGSNFDISTAVFGTHLYKNKLPSLMLDLVRNYSHNKFMQTLQIDAQIQFIKQIKNSYFAYIIDIQQGADTRVMVKGFLTQLKKQEQSIQDQFFSRSKIIVGKLFEAISSKQSTMLKHINSEHRKLQQQYTKITQIPIQPDDLTALIDSLLQLENVCYAICPGSGGYDAIFVLANRQVRKQIQATVSLFSGVTKTISGYSVHEMSIIESFQQIYDITEQQVQRIQQALKEIYSD